jgi:ADP-ribose pyrophosphatase
MMREGAEHGAESVIRREIIRHPGAVVILPVLSDGRIALIQSYRPALDLTIWELPAGTLDQPDETPIECAVRELREETGCEAGTVTPLGCFYTTSGLTDEQMHAFLAIDCVQKGTPSLEPGEEISVCLKEPDVVYEMIRSGELCDGKSMLTLLLARDRVMRRLECE